MDRSTLVRTGIAGTVAGLGLAVGGVALATADDQAPDNASASSVHPGGPRGDHGRDGALLAEELGLDQSDVAEALEAVREDLRPEKPADGTRPERPSEEQRAEHQAALAAALAKELNLSEAKVAAALAAVQEQAEAGHQERRAEIRTDLSSRLDEAVDDGTLTAADKASVLKAFDAEVLGAGPGGGHGGGPGGGSGRR